MPEKHNNEDSFRQEMITQWQRIGQRLHRDMPSFNKVQNNIIQVSMRHHADHPVARLFKYIDFLDVTSQQALYSLERLRRFSITEASNVSEFYVSHYLYDFLARVKTVTDLLALIINYVFKMGLPEKDCSLEKGKLCNMLIQRFKNKNPNNQAK